jgi:putative ABC transport system permease protein
VFFNAGVAMETLFQDIRYALRALRKAPVFSLSVVATLALGVAATAALFSILEGAYIHFGQTDEANRVVLINQRFPTLNSDTDRFSPAEYVDIAGLHELFDGFFAVRVFSPTLTETEGESENPERIPGVRATANIFQLYGIAPILGRVFTPLEDQPGGNNVAVMTYRLWDRRFKRNPAIVGKVIRLDGVAYTIVGITPRRFQQWGADVLIPLQLDPAATLRSQRTLMIAGIPKSGVSLAEAQGELQQLARRVEAEYGSANSEYAGLTYEPLSIRTIVVGDLRIALYILLGAAALLLLIAAANIANLMLARVMSRASEIGLRLALGGTAMRVVRQFLVESLMLGSVAGVLGFLLGMATLNPILALIPDFYIGEETEIHASPTAFLISIGIALLLSTAFGLAPLAFVGRRNISENLLRRYTRSVTDRRTGRIRPLLVSSEMALAFVVIASAGLMVRTYRQLISLDLGFRPDHVLTMRTALLPLKYRTSAEIENFYTELQRRVGALPGVSRVALTSIRPMDGEAWREFSIPGRPLGTVRGRATAAYRVITPDYFQTIGTPLREGRFFAESDGSESFRVAQVNESFARTWFANEDVLGKTIQLQNLDAREGVDSPETQNDTVQIIGVVRDSRQYASRQLRDLYDAPPPEIYVPFRQHAAANRDMAIMLRTVPDPATLTDAVRTQVLGIDAGQPIYDPQTLDELADLARGPSRLALVLLSVFAGIALLVASVGLYAVISYSVTQRTQEIGIRMAVGARPRAVLSLILKDGMRWAGIGLVFGFSATLALSHLMSSLLYQVHPNDSVTLVAASVVLIAVALLAVYFPARRATKVSPMAALRTE